MRWSLLLMSFLFIPLCTHLLNTGRQVQGEPYWRQVRFGMRLSDVESLRGRPSDYPPSAPGDYGFAKASEIADTLAAWDGDDVVVLFKNGRAIYVFHGFDEYD